MSADSIGVPEITLDGSSWRTADDFYSAFFRAVGAPSWHGRNLNALRDSIQGGQINDVEVPYHVSVLGTSKMGTDAREMVSLFRDLVTKMREEGCPISITVS